ncbi:MAG: hypothetical protein JJT75_13740 [Opitutales bacterium]|nr:hypothetical protein [Opitutales bacterium]MCH8541597.1 hypothetical protein [Opitutales bacterium]
MSDRDPQLPLPSEPPPKPSQEARERAWQAARTALQESCPKPSCKISFSLFPALTLAAAACLALVLGGWLWWTSENTSTQSIAESPEPAAPESPPKDFAALEEPTMAYRILEELQSLFPGQFAAYISSPEKSEIVTAESSSTYSSQPVLVELRSASSTLQIVSFSGQTITTKVEDKEYSLEFLITGDGHLLITGEDFHWHSADPGDQSSSPFTIHSTIL